MPTNSPNLNNNISFSKEIKEELTLNDDLTKEAAISLLSAFIKCNGDFVFGQKEKIIVKSDDVKIIKYIYSLFKKLFDNINLSFSYRRRMRFNKSTEFLLNILSNIDEVIDVLKIDFLDNKINSDLVNKDDKLRGYLIGLFLSSGSCSNPKSSNYHFEIYSKDENYAKSILKLISKIKVYVFSFKMIKRRNQYVIYLKKSDEIASFIAYLGASDSSLTYEGFRLDRDFKNYTNRQTNLDMYNYNKSISNSEKLIETIKNIDKFFGINNIQNIKLRTLCKLRLEYPESSYSDLASLMSKELNMNISKSNVNHLIIKIREMGNRYNNIEKKE